MASEDKRIDDELSYPIVLVEHIRVAVDESKSFRTECGDVGKQVDRLSQMLRTVVRFTTSVQSVYERPVRRVVLEVSKNLESAVTLVRKCKRKRQSVRRRVLPIVSASDFRKLLNLLDASLADMKWLLSIFDSENGDVGLTLPPIASNNPILAWVWSYLSAIQMGQLSDRKEAAYALASLAEDNDHYKMIIVKEGGVPPLLKLLKETASSDAQIAAASALYNIADERERVRAIVKDLGVPTIVNVLSNSIMKVQNKVASLVARMAEHDELAQEEFARENVIRPLVSLLSFETFVDNPRMNLGKHSIDSIVQINIEMEKNSFVGSKNYRPYMYSESSSSSSRSGQNRKDRENEDPKVKIMLKIACAEALWKLARGSEEISRRITETKGLLCLAKLVEKEQGELLFNCLMTIMEITAAAESNADLRRAAFKTNSRAAKAVVDQMLRVINELDSPALQIPAIKSIGSLAKTFHARETRVLGPLVAKLSHLNEEVARETAIALQKFACPENFLCVQHSKEIIDINGVPPLMRLLKKGNDQTKLDGVVLLCYLALHAGNSEALEQARVLTTLEGADRTVIAQHPELKGLMWKATYHLSLYHTGVHSQRLEYLP